MAFATLCKLDGLLQGESASFTTDGQEIVLVWLPGGELKAFQGTCPHQEISLANALFDGRSLMCQAHRWKFDARTGHGMSPPFLSLKQFALRIEAGDVQVDVTCEVSDTAVR